MRFSCVALMCVFDTEEVNVLNVYYIYEIDLN